jgi:hypothetical protein
MHFLDQPASIAGVDISFFQESRLFGREEEGEEKFIKSDKHIYFLLVFVFAFLVDITFWILENVHDFAKRFLWFLDRSVGENASVL